MQTGIADSFFFFLFGGAGGGGVQGDNKGRKKTAVCLFTVIRIFDEYLCRIRMVAVSLINTIIWILTHCYMADSSISHFGEVHFNIRSVCLDVNHIHSFIY